MHAEHAPVCRACAVVTKGICDGESITAAPRSRIPSVIGRQRQWAAPNDLVFLYNATRCTNRELNRQDALLPVTHVAFADDRPNNVGERYGAWYYYARGCSDLGLDVGNTFAARNRIALFLVLEAMVHGSDDVDLSAATSAAVASNAARAADRIMKGHYGKNLQGWTQYALSTLRVFRNVSALSLGDMLKDAARGMYAPAEGPPLEALQDSSWCGVQRPCDRACLRRAVGLNRALRADDRVFDQQNAMLMHRLQRRRLARGLPRIDTVQILEGGFTTLRPTPEIWEVRHTPSDFEWHHRLGSISYSPAFGSRRAWLNGSTVLRWINGSACYPSSNQQCWACAGSRLEQSCSRGLRVGNLVQVQAKTLDARDAHGRAAHGTLNQLARPRAE